MPSLLQKLHHKHHSTSSSSGSGPTSPKLETLTLSSSPATLSSSSSAPSTRVATAAPDSTSSSTSSSSGPGLKSILRTSTVSSSGSSAVDNELVDGQPGSGASTPRTSLIAGSSSGSKGHGTSVDGLDIGEEALGCKSINVLGQTCCYAIIAFSRTNVLQFINLPHSLHVPILEAIRASWHKGVSSHGTPKVGGGKLGGGETVVDVWEVHLNGLVWGARGTRAGIAIRRLVSQLLTTLSQHSFGLVASIDASFKDSSRDTMYLRKRIEPTTIPTQFLSMSFQDDDKIWMIDAPQAVIESVEEAVGYAWPQGIQKSGPLSKDPGCWEIRIKGTPWSSHSHSQQISSRLLHLHLLRAVYVQGFKLKGSISLADKDEGEMDSLFFESRVEGDD